MADWYRVAPQLLAALTAIDLPLKGGVRLALHRSLRLTAGAAPLVTVSPVGESFQPAPGDDPRGRVLQRWDVALIVPSPQGPRQLDLVEQHGETLEAIHAALRALQIQPDGKRLLRESAAPPELSDDGQTMILTARYAVLLTAS